MKLKIGLDFDNTLICYDDVFRRLARRRGWLKGAVRETKEKLKERLIAEDGDDRRWQALQADAYGKWIRKAKAFPGGLAFVRRALQEGHEVFIVSHKTKTSNFDHKTPLRDWALRWLKDSRLIANGGSARPGVRRENIRFASTREEKLGVIGELKLDVFVDDLLPVLEHPEFPKATHRIHFRAPANGKRAFAAAGSWSEVSERVGCLASVGRAAYRAIEEGLGSRPVCAQAAPGGNNRVLKLRLEDGRTVALKRYLVDPRDTRQRAKAEFDAYQLLADNGVSRVPRPHFADPGGAFAVFSWIEGRPFGRERPTAGHVRQAAEFLREVAKVHYAQPGRVFAEAADARARLSDYPAHIERRLSRIRDGIEHLPDIDGLRRFFFERLLPLKERLLERFYEEADVQGLDLAEPLSDEERILSPSDFGFHNALIDAKGKLHFFDFEYFGLDDPAKLAADFQHHVGQSLSEPLQKRFQAAFAKGLKHRKRYEKRLALVRDLIGLEWVLIVLNVLAPEILERRKFSNPGVDKSALIRKRLGKAKSMTAALERALRRRPRSKAKPPARGPSVDYASLARRLRRRVIEIVAAARRGHIGSAFSLIEVLLVLYKKVLRVDPKRPDWEDRDRLIFSKGHGCLALYPILAEMGFFPEAELSKFCQPGGILGGHPEAHHIPGVEASTGALGHGMSIGIGMALAARMNRKNYRVYVVVGDGECDEGSVWEAALSAGKHRLDNFTVLVDYNKQQSYSYVSEVMPLEPFAEKWRAFGFEVREANMDRPEELERILTRTRSHGRPRVVLCHTIKGKGVSFIERNLKWHHKSRFTDEELASIFAELED